MIPYEAIASAIYITEGSNHTMHPYGIMHNYQYTSPRQACINTIKSIEKHSQHHFLDREFIYILSNTYCPPSVDIVGNHNWKVNMIRILKIKD